MNPKPNPDDYPFDAWDTKDGIPVIVTVLEPLRPDGDVVMCRHQDGRFQCSIDMLFATKLDALRDIELDLLGTIENCEQAIAEADREKAAALVTLNHLREEIIKEQSR